MVTSSPAYSYPCYSFFYMHYLDVANVSPEPRFNKKIRIYVIFVYLHDYWKTYTNITFKWKISPPESNFFHDILHISLKMSIELIFIVHYRFRLVRLLKLLILEKGVQIVMVTMIAYFFDKLIGLYFCKWSSFIQKENKYLLYFYWIQNTWTY